MQTKLPFTWNNVILPAVIRCPVPDCESNAFWHVYTGNDPELDNARIAEVASDLALPLRWTVLSLTSLRQCAHHGMVAYRRGHVAGKAIHIIPYALTSAQRVNERASSKSKTHKAGDYPCFRCGVRGRNQRCGANLCEYCCTMVTYCGLRIRCGLRAHDGKKPQGSLDLVALSKQVSALSPRSSRSCSS